MRLFLIVMLTMLPVFSLVNYLESVPRPNDDYFALYTLGAKGTAEHYFPEDQTDILPGENLTWYVGLYNHMTTVRYVMLSFKILNGTMRGPDDVEKVSSTRQAFFEKSRLLMSNETWILPISWSVSNATKSVDGTTINSLLFNGQALSRNVVVSATGGYNFRIVIELWVYDGFTGDFSFPWISNGENNVAWNQVWFNMTRVSLLPS